MKTRDIILVVITSILMFVLGGLVVYQVVTPKENKEEEKTPSSGECIELEENKINFTYNHKTHKTYINNKLVVNPCSEVEGTTIETFNPNSIRIINNYAITKFDGCGGAGYGLAIFNDKAEQILHDGAISGKYVVETEKGYSAGHTIKDSNGTHYWEETTVDLTGNKANIKTTKEKINVDCKVYGGDNYENLSEKDKIKYYECCTDCM